MAARWIKIWVPQPITAGGRCSLFKWVKEDALKDLQEKETETEKPEPTTEVLFLCNYQGCGKTFHDAVALRKHAHIHGERRCVSASRKHAHIHGERQYDCEFEGCGKSFRDSSKLKRHFLIHTGERDFVCDYEGCGKAFSLKFNLKSHMLTHYPENYHVCTYPKCGKRFIHVSILMKHVKAQHEKAAMIRHTPAQNKRHNASKTPSGSGFVNRPYVCPYEGCGKAYIHEYKLNLHLKKEHLAYYAEEDGFSSKNLKRSNSSMTHKIPPPKIPNRMVSGLAPTDRDAVKNQWPSSRTYEDDSEETYGDDDMAEGHWKDREVNEHDEETEDED